MLKTQSESALELKLVEALESKGFKRVRINNYDELKENLRNQLFTHNKSRLNNKPLTDKEFKQILLILEGENVFKSAVDLRQLHLINRDNGQTAYIELLNKSDWCKNEFQVTNQITVFGKRENRYDVTILINGLPLVQIELKRRGLDMKQAFNQINRYKRETYNGLFNYIQLFIVSNGVDTKYLSNDNRNLAYEFSFFWTNDKNEKITNLNDFAMSFLTPCHIAKVIAKYMVINETDKKLMVMRPYQIHAVERMVELGTETRNNGYVWHATGSGKTLTSFKLSQILSESIEDVKIIFLVDRKDLDAQTLSEFNKFQPDSVDFTKNTNTLIKNLKDSSKKLIITTIQKLAIAVKSDRYEKDMTPFKDKRVIFIVDECHRSQFGKMHKDIQRHFKKAQFFGFTGTPIFEENANDGVATGDLFGRQVHNYMIKDGIRDGNILGFKVDYLRTFTIGSQATDDDVEDIDTEEIVESDKRIEQIAKKIIEIHPIKTRNQQYNALFAVSKIKMAIKYYETFKKLKPNLVIGTVFTYAPNDDLEEGEQLPRDMLDKFIEEYNKQFGTNFNTDNYQGYFADLVKRFKTKQIDILIVVDMLLTGFDAPLLNTLYLDKKLKYHGLIQAFSRTNRIHGPKKPFGNIVSFLTKKDDVDEAVYLYSQSDNTDVVIQKPYNWYVEQARKQIQILRVIAPNLKSIDKYQTEADYKTFVEAFKAVARIISMLENFIEFKFTAEELGMNKQEFEDYKSKYFDISRKASIETEKTSVLKDVDFEIDLLTSDKINVDYILKLIANLSQSDRKSRDRDITRIINIIKQNDTPELHSKMELLRKFLERIVPTLKEDDFVEEKYNEFIKDERLYAIKLKSEELKVETDKIINMIEEFQFSGVMPNEALRKNIEGNFLDKTKKLNTLREFIREVSELYV
jgi:type I restriction enzyme R subunit